MRVGVDGWRSKEDNSVTVLWGAWPSRASHAQTALIGVAAIAPKVAEAAMASSGARSPLRVAERLIPFTAAHAARAVSKALLAA